MSQHYGQSIIYGPLSAPALFTGDNMSFNYRDQVTEDDLEDGGSDFAAMGLHSRKGDLGFDGEVTSGSTDFLDLSGGSKIAVAGTPAGIDLSVGMILAYEAVEEWNLLRRKRASVRAAHYPDATDEDGAAAGALSAFTPTQNLDFLFPGNTLIYSTVGFTHAAGLVHMLRVTQSLTITDDDPSPDGKLLGAFTSGYIRKISLLLLGKPADAAIPAPKSVLTLTGAPDHLKNYRVISSEPRMDRKKGMMFSIDASWIPPFGTGA
jgi:hypothetical protein